METENDVEDVQQTRLTKKHVRTLDTWKVHFEEWKGDQEVFRSDQCTVKMSKIRNMLNYTPGTYFKDRWLNDETIFAYASIFENDWCKTIGTTEYMSFERTGQLPKRWAAKCSNLAKASHILMPINCARTHWMMADIQPQSNEITIMDSYNHELMKRVMKKALRRNSRKGTGQRSYWMKTQEAVILCASKSKNKLPKVEHA